MNYYFHNLQKCLAGIVPGNIFNYNKTELRERCIIQNHLLAWCFTEMLPEIFYHLWYMNIGQDMDQTEQFMMQPKVDGLITGNFWWKEEGPFVIIWDNLRSHFSTNVTEECYSGNIIFICLPPNATHLWQLLDLAVFWLAKIKWKYVLDTWQRKLKSKDNLPNTIFSTLLP